MKRHSAARLACLGALLTFASAGAQAATITVNSSADDTATDGLFCSIREAVANANDNAQTYPDCAAGNAADRIVFGSLPNGQPITSITLHYFEGGTLHLTDSAQTTIDGGGARVALDGDNAVRILVVETGASVQLTRMVLDHGHCSTSGCNGAAIYNKGTLGLTQSTVQGSVSDRWWGGGIYSEGTLTLTGSEVKGNSAGLGGGLYNTGTLNLDASTVSGNTGAASGGGLYNTATATLKDTTVSGNTGSNNTGAILNNGTLTLTNTTVSGNNAPFVGGIQNFGSAAQLSIVSSTISGNQSRDVYGENNSARIVGSIVTSMLQAVTADSYGNLIGDVANVNLGPLQNNLPYNAGITQTRLPGAGSVAIDAIGCADLPATDQRGVKRAQGAYCDIGAVEVESDVLFANGFEAAAQCSGVTGVNAVWLDEFNGDSLNAAHWNANANGGSLVVANGSVSASSSANQFPFVTAIAPIPASGPFSVRWKSTYTNTVVNGTGTLVLSKGLPANGASDDYALRRADAWQDSNNGFQVRARASDAGSYGPVLTAGASSSAVHDVEVCWLANTVEIWVDGALKSSSSNASLTRPDALWFGNPVVRVVGDQPWTSFALDAVRVNTLTMQ